MGLAPYGEPRHVDTILKHLVDVKPDGSLAMDMSYFNYCQGLTMTNDRFAALFGGPARNPESAITQREMDIAASIQRVTEEVVLRMARHAKELTGSKNLCLAGGVALNCVANGKLLREKIFEDVFFTRSKARYSVRSSRTRTSARSSMANRFATRSTSKSQRSSKPWRRKWPPRKLSAGSAAGWSSGRARSGRAASSATHAAQRCSRR